MCICSAPPREVLLQPHSLDFGEFFVMEIKVCLNASVSGRCCSFHLWWDFELVAFCEQRRNLSSQNSAIARSYNRLGTGQKWCIRVEDKQSCWGFIKKKRKESSHVGTDGAKGTTKVPATLPMAHKMSSQQCAICDPLQLLYGHWHVEPGPHVSGRAVTIEDLSVAHLEAQMWRGSPVKIWITTTVSSKTSTSTKFSWTILNIIWH
jgi:hypothetical protein